MHSKEAGGGYLMGMSPHGIDHLHALFGAPASVCAEVHTSTPVRRREDGTELDVTAANTSTILLRFASGLVATIATSMTGLHTDVRTVELYGSEGAVRIDGVMQGAAEDITILAGYVEDEGLHVVAPIDRTLRNGVEVPERRAGPAIKALALLIEDWLSAFDEKPTPDVPSLFDGYVTRSIIDAARLSSSGSCWVGLDLSVWPPSNR